MHRPKDYKELFNLCHAQLHNVIERIFGIVKRKFPMLNDVCKYNLATQRSITIAFAAMFNFNQIHLPADNDFSPEDPFEEIDANANARIGGSDDLETPFRQSITAQEKKRAKAQHEAIAKALWASYQAEFNAHEMRDIN